jgi:hypothetical protein
VKRGEEGSSGSSAMLKAPPQWRVSVRYWPSPPRPARGTVRPRSCTEEPEAGGSAEGGSSLRTREVQEVVPRELRRACKRTRQQCPCLLICRPPSCRGRLTVTQCQAAGWLPGTTDAEPAQDQLRLNSGCC